MMITRRDVIRGLAATTAAASGPLLGACAQTASTQSTLALSSTRVIDIHAHCVIPEVEPLLAASNIESPGFLPWQILGPSRLDDMDARRIDTQVLSINRFWWYRADASLAEDIVNLHDQTLSNWCSRYPDRFTALCSVALQHPELAAEQLTRAVREYGLRGASIGGTVLGESVSSRQFDPFWAAAESLDVPVFMHPNNGAYIAADGSLAGNGDLGNIIGNPLETTVFLTRLIFDGTFDRFPRLKICAPHAGGYLPSYMGRTEVACEVRNTANCQNRRPPSEYLRRQVFFDSMVFSDEGLRHLIAEVGASQVVYGSDMPFNWPDTIDLVVDADYLSADEKRAVLGGNLEKLLRLEPRSL